MHLLKRVILQFKMLSLKASEMVKPLNLVNLLLKHFQMKKLLLYFSIHGKMKSVFGEKTKIIRAK